MLLLSAIALFNPDRSNVVHKDVVKKEQVSHVSHVSQVKLVMLVILVMSVKLVKIPSQATYFTLHQL